jgi:Ca2+-binding RTX toxin-like protein
MPGTATTILIDGTPTDGADEYIDSLVWGGRWIDEDGGKVTISYAAANGEFEGADTIGWSVEALAALDSALALWESVANIDFVKVQASEADALFWAGTQSQAGGRDILGWSEIPGYNDTEVLNTLYNAQDLAWSGDAFTPGSFTFVTMVHEIGHLLGLAHPHDGGSAPDATTFPGVTWPWDGASGGNSGFYTTMTYNDGFPYFDPDFYSDPYSLQYGLQYGPMAFDIAAIQTIYGANTTYASGNDTYYLPTTDGLGTYWSSIWDTGGIDTISNAGSSLIASIYLSTTVPYGMGVWSYVQDNGITVHGGYSIPKDVVIENAIGGSNQDTLEGNSANNVLDGRGLDDYMAGLGGDDTYYVDTPDDQVVEEAGEGNDKVYASVDYTLAANVENLVLNGRKSIHGTGNDLENVLTGNAANNMLDGAAGADTMEGGAGNDKYIVDNTGDVVSELADGGVDTVLSSVIWTLGANLERLTLTGLGHVAGTGNELNNILTGNDGDNVLDGKAGADTMTGGLGDDTYVVDSAGDVVTEAKNQGTDTVEAWVGWTLGANFEQLRLMGTAGLNGTGNDLDNVLTGNDLANDLLGLKGNDTIRGGAGNDVLDGGTGVDTADYSTSPGSIRVDLAAGTAQDGFSDLDQLIGIENVAGSAFGDEIYGNGSANRLLGNDGDDSLYGDAGDDLLEGGAGSDVLAGGLGADALSAGGDADYLLIDGADTAIDGGAGFDSVFVQTAAPVTLDMGAASIEWVQGSAGNDTFDAASQTGAVYIYGMGGDDTLTGSAFGDYLDGGDGTDTLAGGDGADLMLGNGGSDILRGDGGDDSLIELGDDSVIDGGAGFDSLFVWSDTGVTLDLTASSIEWVQGSVPGDDNLNGAGNTVNTFLYGWGGNDVLTAGSADDYIAGGAGDDVLTGGAGNDTLIGETGFDRYVYTDTVWGSDTIHSFDFNGETLDFTAVAAIDSFSDFATHEWDPLGLGYNSTTLFYTSGGTTSAITLIGVQTVSLSDADFLFA